MPFVTRQYFFDFLQQFYTESRENEIDADIFELIQQYPEKSSQLLEQYRQIDIELNKLTAGFEDFVDNDPIFNRDTVGETLQASWVDEKKIDDIIWQNALSVFLKEIPLWFKFIGEEDPKRRFINQVLVSMLLINTIFMLVLVMFVVVFLRKSFQPIHMITDTLDSFTAAGGKTLEYHHNDEFQPLIDSLNNLRERLDHQEVIRSQFLTDMSHELKTPMTAISVYLEGIREGVIQLNPANINALSSELARLARIVEDLMNFQLFESQPTVFYDESFFVYDVVSIVKETHLTELDERMQTINYVWSKRAIMVFDKDKMLQIFHNIVANFIRYAGVWTQLRVNFFSERNMDIFVFQDNGVGVGETDLPYLREKFYQVDKAKSGDIRDRWIWVGLSIIDKIIRDAGGYIHISSTFWEGFTLRIELPRRSL